MIKTSLVQCKSGTWICAAEHDGWSYWGTGENAAQAAFKLKSSIYATSGRRKTPFAVQIDTSHPVDLPNHPTWVSHFFEDDMSFAAYDLKEEWEEIGYGDSVESAMADFESKRCVYQIAVLL